MSMLRNLPFAGDFPISLRFGESKDLFRQVSYKGVPLLGHPGIDYDLPLRTPVLAVQHGVVLDVRSDSDNYGNSVLLGHRWGQTFYAHLSEVRVEKGQQAAAGQTIGLSGDSGNIDHPAMHFGIRLIPYSIHDGWCGFTDPAPYLARLTQPRGAIIGPHIIGSIRPHLEVLSRWRPRMITLLDPSPDDLLALRDVCPDSTIVARIFVPDHEMSERINSDPVEAAEWAHEITQTRMAYGVDYWQVANEVHQDSDGLRKLNEFELTRMQLAEEADYRCGILGFGVGNPDLPENDRMAVWRHVYPALSHAEANGHVVALHQYGMPDLWGPNNAYDWYIYRLEHQVMRRLPFRKLKFAVTEYGIDGLIRGSDPSGWQNFTTPEGYVEQLLKCGRYLERFSGQVLGYTIFTLGHYNPWQSYDIIGKAAAYLADLSEKGTWREIDAQVYDIVPRDTDSTTDPGPTITAIVATGEDDELPNTAPLDPETVEGASGFDAETEESKPPLPESEKPEAPKPKSRRGKKGAETTEPPGDQQSDEQIAGGALVAGALLASNQVDSSSTANDESPSIDVEDSGVASQLEKEDAEDEMEAVDRIIEYQPETTILKDWDVDPTSEVPASQPEGIAEPATESAVAGLVIAEIISTMAESPGDEEEPPPPGRLIDQRIALPFAAYNMAVKGILERPDQPLDGLGPLAASPSDAGEVVYLVKDVFMTYYGSWEPSGDYESVPEWARDDYLRQSFLEAGADHHLFAAVIGLDGQLRKGHEIVFWSDGFEKLDDSSYTDYTRERTKDNSSWANLFMAGGSSFVPERGDIGPWCWAPVGAAEVVVGGGLPVGHPVSTFVVWQAVPRSAWEATLKPDIETPVPPPPPTDPEVPPPDEGPTPDPTVEVIQRISDWATHYNITIKSVAQRPDNPDGDVVYKVKDIFTTLNGSWEPSGLPGSVPQWARDDYLKPFGAPDYFDDAGGDHHLFAAVIGLDGKLVRNQDIIYWSDGFIMLGDPEYNGFIHRMTKEKSGWANVITGPGSSFVPEREESGPWCWAPSGASEVVCGGGLPANHHVSFFVVWQAVPAKETPDDEEEDTDSNIYIPTVPKELERASMGGQVAESQEVGVLRKALWNRLGIELPRNSLFAEYARRNNLGRPVTNEFEENGHLIQGYNEAWVLMPIGHPELISHLPW